MRHKPTGSLTYTISKGVDMRRGFTFVLVTAFAFWVLVALVIIPPMLAVKQQVVEYPRQMICGIPPEVATDIRENKHSLSGCPEIVRDLGAPERT